ncbi:thioesterase II family protein [Stappia indica]|uniref:thioesterase II family protein n=1 Tax=Stappia indica TaxID=538381 RepID=UPI000836CFA4|nr:alpha/beta fold hydrolase [Stappia indica]
MSAQAEIFASDRSRAAVDLYVFHHAGGSRHSFAAWQSKFPAEVALHRVQLPGRTAETCNVLPKWAGALVPGLVRNFLASRAGSRRPFVFYGHSLGALIAFELTRFLRLIGEEMPAGLVVASRRAPHCELSHGELFSLPDDELVAALHRLGGVPAHMRGKEDWLRQVLPVIRADLQLSDIYRYAGQPPLDCPMLAVKGSDDPIMSLRELIEWSAHTTGSFTCGELPGAHFFDAEGTRRLETILVGTLARWADFEPAGMSARPTSFPEERTCSTRTGI